MKILFLIPLIAVIVHATPAIQNDRVESFQASDSLDGRAHLREITASCFQCGDYEEPFCVKCATTGLLGECWSTHRSTCDGNGGGAVPSEDIGCEKGSWGCVVDCCKK